MELDKIMKQLEIMTAPEKLGREFSPSVETDVYQTKKEGWKSTLSIGEEYYESDPYKTKRGALLELRGCIIGIMEDLQKELNDMTNELG